MSGFESPNPATQPAPTPPATPASHVADAAFTSDDQPRPNESPSQAFWRNVKKCGRESALGRDSLPNLVGYIAEAVNNGALNPNDKFPSLEDPTKKVGAQHYIFAIYSTEEGKKAVHERSKLSQRAQASKLKQVIEASAKPNINFRGTLQKALEMRKGLFERYDRTRLKSAFDHYVSLARTQIKQDTDLTDTQIEGEALKSEGEENTPIKELQRVHKKLKKLLGEPKEGEVRLSKDDPLYPEMSSVLDTILEAIRTEEPDYDKPKPEAAKPADGATPAGAPAVQPGASANPNPGATGPGGAFEMGAQQPQQ